MRLCIQWVEVVQPRDHVPDGLHTDKGLESADDAAPACVAARETLRTEERLVEAHSAYDGAKYCIELAILVIKALCEVLKEGLHVGRVKDGAARALNGKQRSGERGDVNEVRDELGSAYWLASEPRLV